MSGITVTIARDFSETPGPRYRTDGKFSGEEFRHKVLLPAFLKARSLGVELLVDLDGTEGYATSFLEESFGGIAREYGATDLERVLQLKSDEEPYLITEVLGYIRDAKPEPAPAEA